MYGRETVKRELIAALEQQIMELKQDKKKLQEQVHNAGTLMAVEPQACHELQQLPPPAKKHR